MPKANINKTKNRKITNLVRNNRELLREKSVNPGRPKEVKARIDEYLLECEKTGQLPTVQKLALKLGVDFETYLSWFDPKTAGVAIETIDLLTRTRDAIASIMTDLSLTGDLNLGGYTFHAQNYLGLSKDGKKQNAKERKNQQNKVSKKQIEDLKKNLDSLN
jgi:hypothetical protein